MPFSSYLDSNPQIGTRQIPLAAQAGKLMFVWMLVWTMISFGADPLFFRASAALTLSLLISIRLKTVSCVLSLPHCVSKGPITWRISARAEISAQLTGLKLQPGF